jgi:hypothetical protein
LSLCERSGKLVRDARGLCIKKKGHPFGRPLIILSDVGF